MSGVAPPATGASGRLFAVVSLALVWGLAALLRASVADIPLERDEGEYAYTAWRWLAGDVPYRDSFLHKPPGAPAVYAGILVLVGGTPSAIHWGAQIWSLLTLTCIVALGRRWFSPSAGLAAGLVGALLVVDPSLTGNAANTEVLSLVPLTLAIVAACLAVDRKAIGWAVAAGAAGAAALTFKPVTAPISLLAAGMLLASRRRWPLLAGFGTGALGVAAVVNLYFVWVGAWSEFWDASVLYNLGYAAWQPGGAYLDTLRIQGEDLVLVVCPLLVAAALGAGSGLPAGSRSGGRWAGWAWCLVWLAASALAISAGGHFRRHYFMFAVPPLALLASAGLDAVGRRLPVPRWGAWVAPAAAIAWVVWCVALAPWYYLPGPPDAKIRRIYANNPFAESGLVAGYLAGQSDASDRVFVYGSEPQILFYARRQSASRYMFSYPLTAPFAGVRARQSEALAEIRRLRPRFVVFCPLSTSLLIQPGTPPELHQGLERLVTDEYRAVAMTPFRPDGSVAFVSGPQAQRAWDRRPLWDGGTPWLSLVVFERLSPDAPGPEKQTQPAEGRIGDSLFEAARVRR